MTAIKRTSAGHMGRSSTISRSKGRLLPLLLLTLQDNVFEGTSDRGPYTASTSAEDDRNLRRENYSAQHHPFSSSPLTAAAAAAWVWIA